MWQALRRAASRLLDTAKRSLRRTRLAPVPLIAPPPQPISYGPLRRVLLSDGVAHTLFEEYAQHRSEARGDEETGWVLLGLRSADEAVVLATLPAGTEADASVAHVRFNSDAQAVAYRIVRQRERRLTIVGVVHTHPGSCRPPERRRLPRRQPVGRPPARRRGDLRHRHGRRAGRRPDAVRPPAAAERAVSRRFAILLVYVGPRRFGVPTRGRGADYRAGLGAPFALTVADAGGPRPADRLPVPTIGGRPL